MQLDLDLENKVVVITGVAHGLGRALAESLHAQGATIVGHYKSSQVEAESLAANLKGMTLYQADLRDSTQIKNMKIELENIDKNIKQKLELEKKMLISRSRKKKQKNEKP